MIDDPGCKDDSVVSMSLKMVSCVFYKESGPKGPKKTGRVNTCSDCVSVL